MKKIFILLSTFILITGCATETSSHDYLNVIYGEVLYKNSKKPVPNVCVLLDKIHRSSNWFTPEVTRIRLDVAITDQSGKFVIPLSKPILARDITLVAVGKDIITPGEITITSVEIDKAQTDNNIIWVPDDFKPAQKKDIEDNAIM